MWIVVHLYLQIDYIQRCDPSLAREGQTIQEDEARIVCPTWQIRCVRKGGQACCQIDKI